MKNKRINGTQFEGMVRNGLANLRARETEVNRLNVFPVADGDTGTNMCATLEGGLRRAKSDEILAHYLKGLSEGMLFGARGNSGVILSQFFKGMQLELSRCVAAGPGELRNALIRGYRSAYAAVVKPVEGTMLTVFREGIEHIRPMITRATAIEELLTMYIAEMKKTLAYTPELLPVLKESGVTDSGGQGFIYIVEGMLGFLYGEVVRDKKTAVKPAAAPAPTVDLSLFNELSRFEEGYCMEFILQLLKSGSYLRLFDLDRYIGDIGACGESLVVVRDGSRVKVHIHTHRPEKVIGISRQYGEFLTFKLENMQLQHNEVMQETTVRRRLPHKPLAMVAVVSGEGMRRLYEELGCDVVIVCGETMNASAEEFVDAFDRLSADAVVVFPNDKNVIPAAEQAARLHGGDNIRILPSKTVAEGYFAIAMDVPENDVGFRVESMRGGLRGVTTLMETTATRDCAFHGLTCREGENIVLQNGGIISVNADWQDALIEALRLTPGIDELETGVIFRGAGVSEADTDVLRDRLEREFPTLEAEFIDGGQKVYRFIVGLS